MSVNHFLPLFRIIAFDNDRISVLEKRQVHLVEENRQMKQGIQENLKRTQQMVKVMDTVLNVAVANAVCDSTGEDMNTLCSVANVVCDSAGEDVNALCSVLKSHCQVSEVTATCGSVSKTSTTLTLFLVCYHSIG
jgi:ferritin-like metal-binding protein YciE